MARPLHCTGSSVRENGAGSLITSHVPAHQPALPASESTPYFAREAIDECSCASWGHGGQARSRSHEIMSGHHVGNWREGQSENTHVYTLPCLDSFWEAMVSSLLPA